MRERSEVSPSGHLEKEVQGAATDHPEEQSEDDRDDARPDPPSRTLR
jgi:hypothetical protein